MAAVASPALRLCPRTAPTPASPRCRFSSFAPSYFKFARSFPIQRITGGRTQHLGTLKGEISRSIGNHDGWFHINRIIPLASMDKQGPVVSETPVLEDAASSTQDTPASDSSSYYTGMGGGKPGFISFQGGSYQNKPVESVPHPDKEASRLVWFVGPTILVSFLVLPSLYLRKVLSAVFEDSLLTDFLILFFTEALFYGGVGIFVLLIDKVWRPLQQVAPKSYIWSKSRFFRISSVTTMVLSLIIPLLTMGMVWPWTGPAASATLAPYLVGLVVQFAFEQYARHRKSPSWPVIPIIFKGTPRYLRGNMPIWQLKMSAYAIAVLLSPPMIKTSLLSRLIFNPDICSNIYKSNFKFLACSRISSRHIIVSSAYCMIAMPWTIKLLIKPVVRLFFCALSTILVKQSATKVNKSSNYMFMFSYGRIDTEMLHNALSSSAMLQLVLSLCFSALFQVYRLHQLNRAAQLVTALTFSVRGTDTTNQTLAIMNSLGALLTVLQILGVICVWSLSSFLMRFLPSSDIPDP